MKKITAFLAIFLFAAGTAFAQFAIQGMFEGRAALLSNSADMAPGRAFISGTGTPTALNYNILDGGLRRAFAQQARIGVMAQNLDATFGANVAAWVFPGTDLGQWGHQAGAWGGGTSHFHGWVWWSPTPGTRITIGENPWAFFGANQIVGWGFNANGSEDTLVGFGSAGGNHYGTGFMRGRGRDLATTGYGNAQAAGLGGGDRLHRNTGFYPGFIHPGISVDFRPTAMPELNVILAVPLGDVSHTPEQVNWRQDEAWLASILRTHLSVRYAIPETGTVAFSVIGAPGFWGNRDRPGPDAPLNSPGWNTHIDHGALMQGFTSGAITGLNHTNSPKFFLSFFTPHLVPNMQFNVGVSYALPFSISEGHTTRIGSAADGFDIPGGATYHFPVEFGLGVQYASGPFVMRARFAQTAFGSTRTADGRTLRNPPMTGFGISPSYNLGFMSLHMNAGVQILWEHFNSRDAAGNNVGGNQATSGWSGAFGWHATPYVSMSFANTTLFAGFHVETNGVREAYRPGYGFRDNTIRVHWRIPVGLRFEI